MATLQDLLVDEGFEQRKLTRRIQKKVKFKDVSAQKESIALPTYICHDRKSLDFPKGKNRKDFPRSESSVVSWQREGTDSERGSSLRSVAEGSLRRDEPAIDLAAVKAVTSILSGYIGQYITNKSFRAAIKEKCYSCFVRRNNDSDDGILANMELGIKNVERLVEIQGTKKELKVQSLQYSIQLLSIVASLNSRGLNEGSICGTPNSHLSACAQLYLAIVYKLERNDRISARHLLQVFYDSPFLARTHLLPELWEHLFLPHLLHLKVWYDRQLEIVSNSTYVDKEKKIKPLNEIYNKQMDFGTKQFASYYKEWLKVGAQAPAVPSVPLPSSSYAPSRRKSSDSFISQSSTKSKSLYQSVFGPIRRRQSLDMDFLGGVVTDPWGSKEESKFYTHEENTKMANYFEERKATSRRRSSIQIFTRQKNEHWPNAQMSGYFPFIRCKNEAIEPSVHEGDSRKEAEDIHSLISTNLYKACQAICFSDDLSECEMAIRTMAKACLDSCGDPAIENTLSEVPVIEGILEVLDASNDDEVMELAISILAELVSRNEKNAKIILNSDPQLQIFIRLLRNTTLFLKAAALLYLLRPKAKHMVSMEWIPLVLRVLEFGDQLQTLFTVQCTPQVAAYYLLNQVLTGYDEDKFLDNARQLIALGGLRLLVRRMERGDHSEIDKAAFIIYNCIQADGSCRHYLAKKLHKDSVLDLLALEKDKNPHGHAFALLIELLCLQRIAQRTEFLRGLLSGEGCLNIMNILLAYLHRARPEDRLMIAAILLQLDLLGDPFEFSIYREEAIEAMIEALDCQVLNEKVQEQSAKALLILGGHFSYKGDPVIEKWLLQKAGFDNNLGNSFHRRQITFDGYMHLNEEGEVIKNWQRKAALVWYTRGNKRFLSALSDAIANGIPCLARASLITISWMSIFLHSLSDKKIQSVACSIFVPQLVEKLKDDEALEERILASFSLLNLLKYSDYMPNFSAVDKELVGLLQPLRRVTWTANKLISTMKGNTSPSS